MTYSIVARDPDTHELGVAVQSHYFSVGPIVPWARSGIGAVATQASVEVSHGPLGLELLAGGKSAEETLRALIASDAGAARRQVAIVDARGRVALHTGDRCIAHAGHRAGDGVCVQANMMERESVPDAMLAAYASAGGELSERLLAALDAAEREGGDIRGRQSASILIVAGASTGKSWLDRTTDLRVEDHAEPLVELRRLVRLGRAYRLADEAERAEADGDRARAEQLSQAALALAPESSELAFWAAIALASRGEIERARALLGPVVAREPRWQDLVRRLPAAGVYALDPEAVARLLAG
jgi:uncharacterized Ntn-hydrolase superfamily protein